MLTHFRWPMLALVVLATGLLLAGQTSQAPQTSAPAQGRATSTVASPEAYLQFLSEKLSLTDDQKAKLKPILEDQAQQMKAVRDDPSLSQDQKRAKMKGIHESFHDQINGVLTPEQQTKLKQMKQAAIERHQTGQMEQH